MENILKVTDKVIKSAVRFLISSTIGHTNSLEIKEKDLCINMQFNMMMNMLKPEYARIFLDELLKYSGNQELMKELDKQDTISEIVENMRKVQ